MDHWQDDALCAQVAGDMFFPEQGGSAASAMAICAACPVRAQCLQFALDNHITEGIFGGMPPIKRRKYRQAVG